MYDKEIDFVTNFGKYSLYIYIIHRIPTLIISDYLYINNSYLIIANVISIIICFLIMFISKYIKIVFENIFFKSFVLVSLV